MKVYKIKAQHALILLLLVVGISTTGCTDQKAQAKDPKPAPPSVTVSLPSQKEVVRMAEYTGITEAPETVMVRARVEGELSRIHFKPGQVVNKGDLLFSLDDAHYRAQLNEARAELALRQAGLKRAKAMSERVQKLRKVEAISTMEGIEAKTDMESAQAAVAAAMAVVERAKLNLSYTRITAPISGRINDSRVDVGNLVGAGERTLLTTIVQDEYLYVTFSVSERDVLNYMKRTGHNQSPTTIKTPVAIGLANQKSFPFKGQIDFIENQVNPESGAIRVRAVFPNTNRRVLPGLYAKVQAPVGAAKTELLVPASAVGKDQQGNFLLLVNKDNMVQYQPVVIGPLVDGMRVINQGLKKTDRVIINGLQRTRPGTPVTPVDAKAVGASAKKQG